MPEGTIRTYKPKTSGKTFLVELLGSATRYTSFKPLDCGHGDVVRFDTVEKSFPNTDGEQVKYLALIDGTFSNLTKSKLNLPPAENNLPPPPGVADEPDGYSDTQEPIEEPPPIGLSPLCAIMQSRAARGNVAIPLDTARRDSFYLGLLQINMSTAARTGKSLTEFEEWAWNTATLRASE